MLLIDEALRSLEIIISNLNKLENSQYKEMALKRNNELFEIFKRVKRVVDCLNRLGEYRLIANSVNEKYIYQAIKKNKVKRLRRMCNGLILKLTKKTVYIMEQKTTLDTEASILTDAYKTALELEEITNLRRNKNANKQA